MNSAFCSRGPYLRMQPWKSPPPSPGSTISAPSFPRSAAPRLTMSMVSPSISLKAFLSMYSRITPMRSPFRSVAFAKLA